MKEQSPFALTLASLLVALACSGEVAAPEPAPETAASRITANRAPVVTASLQPSRALAVAGAWPVPGYFDDPDGDTLKLDAASSDTAVVRVVAISSDPWPHPRFPGRLRGVELEAASVGQAEVSMIATDPGGLSAVAVFGVIVEPDPRLALRVLYEATDGPNWAQNDNWLTEAPLEEWHGVRRVAKRSNGTTVEDLDLASNDLSGAIPPEIGNLASLSFLHLNDNDLSGAIPRELGNLASLLWLSLASNDLSGAIPPEIGNLAHEFGGMRFLDLGWNDLTGAIPPELGDLASLSWLDLSSNDLTGAIPPELGSLASLERLDLSSNDLTGAIPPELGSLASLERLDLSSNDLTGAIPPELGSLASLETLDLDYNDFTGAIPPQLGGLDLIWWLHLNDNDLFGPVPSELMTLARLTHLTLHDNPGLCAPYKLRLLRAWLAERVGVLPPCNSSILLLPRSLLREDGNGVSLALPDNLHAPATLSVSDSGVVAASVADGWLELVPRSPGTADVELVPSGSDSLAVAGVVVREAVGTFGIDIVMEQPARLGYEKTMVAAADWWSSVLDGTEWPDRRTCSLLVRQRLSGSTVPPPPVVEALADELLIFGQTTPDQAGAWGARWHCNDAPELGNLARYASAGAGSVWVGSRSNFVRAENVLRHEIGHILGLVLWHPETGLMTDDYAYFTGPRAVEAYRAGGGDARLPGVPVEGAHWAWEGVGSELMTNASAWDGLSLAALADAGYTVDMSKATPWRRNATAVAGQHFHDDMVQVQTVPRNPP